MTSPIEQAVGEPGGRATARERMLACLALALFAALTTTIAATVLNNFEEALEALVGLPLIALGGWWLVVEAMPRRAIGGAGVVVGGCLILAAAADAVESPARLGAWLIVVTALAAGCAASARLSLTSIIHARDALGSAPRFRPKRPVLICNPKSGGGKVERSGLIDRARKLGVTVRVLEPGDDLERLARDAVADGADCLGMAGGDGSQALVASVAIEHRLPFVCISAGTRNHFALDLGLDRNNPVKGLRAYRHGVLRPVDYATVGKRLFLNNASLGLYAEMVDNEEYRDAKAAVAVEEMAQALAGDDSFDLQFRMPTGEIVDDALVILVSNNPYVIGPAFDMAQRRSLTSGRLGVAALTPRSGLDAAGLMMRSLLGRIGSDPNVHSFTTPSFTVESSRKEVNIGVDGEAVTMAAPLEFRIHPLGLELLVPDDSLLAASAKQYRGLGIGGLWSVARGQVPAVQEPIRKRRS